MTESNNRHNNKTTTTATQDTSQTQGRGGKRLGSGRPAGTGKYGEPTKAIRVPEGSVEHIKTFLQESYPTIKQQASSTNKLDLAKDPAAVTVLNNAFDWTHNDPKDAAQIPLYSTKVAAGLPTMADDHLDESLDLNEYLVERPKSTFMLKVEGESMRDAGILPDDILIVDRSEKAKHNAIVIAALDGELTVKRLYQRGKTVKLLPENPDYPEIEIRRNSDLIIWGVVIGSFRRFPKNSFFK